MKKLLASKAAKFIGSALVDVLPLGSTVKTGLQSSIEARRWFQVIMWGVMGIGVLGGVLAFLLGSITMEELKEVLVVLSEISK